MAISVEHILSRNLSEHLSTAVLLLDEARRLIFFNEAAERLVGRPHDDLLEVGDAWPALFDVVDGDVSALARPSPCREPLRMRVPGGGEEALVAWSLPLVGRGDAALGWMVSFWPA